jgi:hypothetical protein
MSTHYRRSGSKKPRAPDLDALSRTLATLPSPEPRAPRTDTQRSVVERLREPLRQALAQGYSFARLAEILARAGLTVQASTLRHSLGPVRSDASDG